MRISDWSSDVCSSDLRGAAAHATGDFGDKVGTLRLDYVLPSTGLRLVDSGVYWPASTDPASVMATASDHRPVWVEVAGTGPGPGPRHAPARVPGARPFCGSFRGNGRRGPGGVGGGGGWRRWG